MILKPPQKIKWLGTSWLGALNWYFLRWFWLRLFITAEHGWVTSYGLMFCHPKNMYEGNKKYWSKILFQKQVYPK